MTGQLSSRNERLAQLQNTLTDRKQTIVELRRKLEQSTQTATGLAKVVPALVIEPVPATTARSRMQWQRRSRETQADEMPASEALADEDASRRNASRRNVRM